jgi:TolA-binding protein
MQLGKLTFLVLIGTMGVSGCDQNAADPTQTAKPTSEEVRRDIGKAADSVAEYSEQTKQDYQRSLDTRIKEMEVEIEKLRLKGDALKDQAKDGWNQRIAELEIKRDAAIAQLAEVGRSSAEAWKDVQKGAQSAWAELDKAFHEASSEFYSIDK